MPSLTLDAIRAEIRAFHLANPIGTESYDAFCAWWLKRRWGLEPTRALAQAPAGNHDWGIDGFYLEARPEGESAILHLIQAKYSGSPQQIRAAVRGFARAMPRIEELLAGRAMPTAQTNPVLERLQAALERERQEKPNGLNLRLRFEVLHLCADGPDALARVVEGSREQFDDARHDYIGGYEVGLRTVFPPDELEPDVPDPARQSFRIRFGGEMVSDSSTAKFFAGFGYLSDLVELYRDLGDVLFSKNVRSYLYKAHEKGPAKHMRESLRRACIPNNGKLKDAPERFAMLHNGVSVAASYAAGDGSELVLREPSILNGCQTVKNAAMWWAERRERNSIDVDAWKAIRVPIRVLVTRDEDLIRDVTVSNNRQNAIRASAFRANDPLQVDLAERFRDELGIFYERQDSSFQNLKKTNARMVEDVYPSSFERPLAMEEVAVAIATASLRPALSVASNVPDLFEDAQYQAIFATEKTRDLRLLVFLRNVLIALPLVLKDLKERDAAFENISQGKFAYPVMRVLSRYVGRNEPDLIREFGEAVIPTFPPGNPLRERLRQLLRAGNSGLQQLLKDNWFDRNKMRWRSATDMEATERTLRTLRLADVDLFREQR